MDIKYIVMEDLKKVIDESIIRNTVDSIHFCYGDGGYEPGNYVYEKKDFIIILELATGEE